MTSKSESYLTNYVDKNEFTDNPDVYLLMRAAGQIESLLGLDAKSRLALLTLQGSLFDNEPC